jgi:predicted transcriptional regulator
MRHTYIRYAFHSPVFLIVCVSVLELKQHLVTNYRISSSYACLCNFVEFDRIVLFVSLVCIISKVSFILARFCCFY